MRYISDCRILSNTEVASGQFRMRVSAPEIASEAKPGQFTMVLVSEGLHPFLRRPLCFERIHVEEGVVSLLYKVEGEGTRLLSRLTPGQTVSLQGPLGNGFPIDTSFARHIIVCGGIGVACFPPLAEALARACGKAPEVVLAARSKGLLLCEEDFRDIGCTLHVATDDGSAGQKAYAAQVLEHLAPGKDTRVYACGPMIMMQTVSKVAVAAGASCLVSLEAQMACGDGACLGCVVESTQETDGERMVRVCLDGPVFDTTIIDWGKHNFAYDL